MNITREDQLIGYAATSEHKTNHVLHLILTLFFASCFLTACATVENSAFSPFYFGPDNISVGEAKLRVRQYIRNNISNNGILSPSTACHSLGIYNTQVKPINYPINECIKDAENYYHEIKAEIDKKIEIEEQAKLKQEEEERIAKEKQEDNEKALKEAEENKQQQALEADLKSGKKKPTSFKEYMIFYEATFGIAVVIEPKIKPDLSFYAVTGTIETIDQDGSFTSELVIDTSIRTSDTRYFNVKIPEELKEEYENTARIGGLFVIIGRYIENKTVYTIFGQEKTIPVFEAVYFKALT